MKSVASFVASGVLILILNSRKYEEEHNFGSI